MSTPKKPYSEYVYGKDFDSYNDLKHKLVERGIPENEIAFIHDANTDKAKQDLFDKVTAGTIRVLIGSTEKCGAGTNVQKRLVALHHLDAPYRPRDFTQRDGRGIRQGNMNKSVRIYTYATERTFYDTAFHEIGHSTGHQSRLNRDLSGGFGSQSYAMEELRAEIASIFMAQDLGIEPSEDRLQNNAAYIQSWKDEIKENPNALFTAIADADKIARYVSSKEQAYRQTKDVEYYAIVEETNAYSEQVYRCYICDEEGKVKPLINYGFAERDALEKELDKIKELDLWKDKTFEEVGIEALKAKSEEKEKAGKVEQEKSTEYIRPSELVAAEVAAKALPVSMDGRGLESLTRMSDRETLSRAETYYGKDGKFSDLYHGKNVLKSEEESEYGLMVRLAMFCGGDQDRLLRVFRSSGQYREEKPNAYYEKMAENSLKFISDTKRSFAPMGEQSGFSKGKQGINSKR